LRVGASTCPVGCLVDHRRRQQVGAELHQALQRSATVLN